MSTSCSPTQKIVPTLYSIAEHPFGPPKPPNRVAAKWSRKLANRHARRSSDSAIVDSGASHIYLTPSAPNTNLNPSAPPVRVGTASGQPMVSSADCDLALPIPVDLPSTGHVMPGFQHNLLGIAPFCDKDCRVVFTKHTVTIYDPDNKPFLTGWREEDELGNKKLWRISLLPDEEDIPPVATAPDVAEAPLDAFSAYDLPSVEALVIYFHATAGFPVKDTWLQAIKAGNYSTWPGLTYKNAAKYCPDTVETSQGHMTQPRQNVRSTKPKRTSTTASLPISVPETEDPIMDPTPDASANELYVKSYHFGSLSKLYTDDCGRFPVRSRQGNNYIMIAYHQQSNTILSAPFKSRADKHRLQAYNSIMQRLKDRNMLVDLQILDNEASKEYKRTIKEDWGVQFQLVPPHNHRRNAAERAIRTFKAHLLAILAGVSSTFPKYLWDLLLPQAELTLNLLRQANADPTKSAWEYFNGPFNYDATPMGPLGIDVLIHKNAAARNSWDFRCHEGWNVGVSLEHYRCQRVVGKASKVEQISDAVEFRHQHLTTPTVTPADRVLHGINTLSNALKDSPSSICDDQLQAISALRDICTAWAQTLPAASSPSPPLTRAPTDASAARVVRPSPVPQPSIPPPSAPRVEPSVPRVEPSAPRVDSFTSTEPVAHRTRSQTQSASPPSAPPPISQPVAHRTRSHSANVVLPARAAQRKYPSAVLAQIMEPFKDMLTLPEYWAMPVLDEETGETLEWRQLRTHPKWKDIYTKSYSNEMGRLCQGVGKGSKGPKQQRVAGTDSFRVIKFDLIPKDRRKEICHTRVVCEYRPTKDDPHRTRITVAGTNVNYPGDVATPTGSLDLVKLMINSVLSRPGAKFACFDVKNFYLDTPMDRPEYVRIKASDIPKEFYDEYNLSQFEHNGWVFFEVVRGAYGLPQSGRLANDLLRTRLEKAGYFEAATTPGLWKHKWRPIQFVLIVDDFGVEYVGKQHAEHLASVLKQYHDISEDWEGAKFAGINLEWNYAQKHAERTCRLSMEDYIRNLLLKFGHPYPSKPQHSPHRCRAINYGAKVQMSPEEDTSPALDPGGIKRIQAIIGALLYYARAVDNKLLVALSTLGTQQAQATTATKADCDWLLDYCATYPDDGVIYRASDMVLAAHSDAGFNNVSKSRSRAGAHIFLSEDDPFPRWNGAVLAIAQIIKHVMSSAAEAESGALFVTAKEMIPLRHALIEMGWPQPPSPIQCDNSTAVGMTNCTLIPRKSKSWDLRLDWLRCRESQKQFRYYWDKGANNHGDYYSKHHPDCHHLAKRPLHAGIATLAYQVY